MRKALFWLLFPVLLVSGVIAAVAKAFIDVYLESIERFEIWAHQPNKSDDILS